MRATVNAVNLRCVVIFPKALSSICTAKIPQNRRSLPASQLICAWMMSFEDHLLLLALGVFFTVIFSKYYWCQLANVLIDTWLIGRQSGHQSH